MNEVIEVVTKSAQENILAVIMISMSSVVALIVLVVDTRKKHFRYVTWKKTTLNLGIYTREWERTEDVILQQLYDENRRLEEENRLFKKRYGQLSLTFIIVLFLIALFSWLSEKGNSIKSSIGKVMY